MLVAVNTGAEGFEVQWFCMNWLVRGEEMLPWHVCPGRWRHHQTRRKGSGRAIPSTEVVFPMI